MGPFDSKCLVFRNGKQIGLIESKQADGSEGCGIRKYFLNLNTKNEMKNYATGDKTYPEPISISIDNCPHCKRKYNNG